MKRFVRSKWIIALMIPFAVYGLLAALSIVDTPFTGPSADAAKGTSRDFVPVVYAAEPTGPAYQTLQQVDQALRDVVTGSRASVVRIRTTIEPKRGQGQGDAPRGQFQFPFPFELPFDFEHPDVPGYETPRQGMGSGVVVSKDGLILTNNHVVDGADRIEVTLDDDREFKAELVGVDARSDVAVVRIDNSDLTPIAFGDSDKLDVGEFVIAIGAPFELSHSATFGIVSAKGRTGILERPSVESAPYEDFIQTDAAINPGNSGGPLLNIRGELVGLNTAIASNNRQNAGIGFAIPSNLARKVMEDLVRQGRVVRAWLGVMITDVDAKVAKQIGLDRPRGALVTNIQEGSPASKVDVKPLDVIIKMDGTTVQNTNHLRNYVSSAPVGRDVVLDILRDGKERKVTVRLGELDEKAPAVSRAGDKRSNHEWMGLTVDELTDEAASKLGYEHAEGVLVMSVEPNSPAFREGIQEGTLILAIGDVSVTSVAEFRKAAEQAGDSALVKWRLGGNYGLSVLRND